MSTTPAETVATLSAAAGMPLGDERCAELAPLFEMVVASAGRLRQVDLRDHEPLGPGASAGA